MILDVAALRERFAGRSVGFWVMQYDRHRIWGATAGMLVNLYRMLA